LLLKQYFSIFHGPWIRFAGDAIGKNLAISSTFNLRPMQPLTAKLYQHSARILSNTRRVSGLTDRKTGNSQTHLKNNQTQQKIAIRLEMVASLPKH